MLKKILFLYLCVLMAAATAAQASAPGLKQYMANIGNEHPKPSSFILCHGHGCRLRTKIRLSEGEWSRVAAVFGSPAASPRAERQQIKQAIGLLEKITGPRAGTQHDRGGTADGAFSDGQMDCEDESLNTGAYLTMMQDRKLLKFHRVAGIAHRGYFFNRWPHRGVQLEETRAHKLFVVDSWFHDNGQPAEIATYDDWKNGWHPEKK